MEYVEDGRSAGEKALEVVDSLLSILPSGVEQYRFDHENGRFVLVDRSSNINRNVDAANIFIGRFGPSNFEEAVDAFLTISSSEPSAIFMILSDFQSDVADIIDSRLSTPDEVDKNIILVSTASHKPYNYSVSVRTNSVIKDEVTAVIRAYGMALDTAFVELTVGNLRVGQRSVACGRDDSVLVTFEIPAASKTGLWGKVELHVADPLPFDNVDYFTMSTERNRSVLIVGNTQRNRVIEAVLRASDPVFWGDVVRKDGGDLSYEDLNSADLVIINNFNGRSRILESFILGAGNDKGIVITLDPDREDDFGRSFLLSSGLSRSAPVVSTVEAGIHPILTDTGSTLWRGFPAKSSGNARVYRFMAPIPGIPLVRLSNARPLVSSAAHSNANIVLISTPIGITQANNLCETGFFVPFVDRLSRYALTGSGQAEEARYAGYAVRNPFFGVGGSGTLYDQDGKLVASWSAQPFVKVDKPGVYSLVSSSGETTYLAISAHPSESKMIFLRPNAQNHGGIYYFDYEQFLEQIGDLSNNVWSHWLWVILGVMLCLEVLLWKKQDVKRK
jgi:hypothetical protein